MNAQPSKLLGQSSRVTMREF